MVFRKEKAKKKTDYCEIHTASIDVVLKEIETKIPLITAKLNTMKYNRKVIDIKSY